MTGAADSRAALEALLTADGVPRAEPPILLPANPYFDLAGEEFGRRLVLSTGNDGVEYCLRPDFTLPIAQDWLANTDRQPSARSYLGRVFRQREEGPVEFNQAGLELLAQPDPEAALDRVFGFALEALAAYGVARPHIRIGSVALFEALLDSADMPDVWRPRIRHRFGHPEPLADLLERLSDPHGANGNIRTLPRADLIEDITGQMLAAGLSINEGRRPEEIADRFLEKQALAATHVPGETIELLRDYLAVKGDVDKIEQKIRNLDADFSKKADSAVSSLLKTCAKLRKSAPGAKMTFEAGFSPRLDYYTGITFEMYGETGEVLASGGEYDRLMQRIGNNEQIAAAGCAVWVDRLEQEATR